ncbi:ABC transporter permease [Streptomyces sp. NBC_01795]|uniref:FtsX-like permease family protein n=1 Tax=Streptomyces sp. NBC_01795 TaxID=2975943 RepID=UPI002DDA8CB8|nr:FtsX-like permease family protein [Streptomyces sp. NBC_01795]WSA93548.1 ABC transporter permease [Streptomyces sp. NBC_01795]
MFALAWRTLRFRKGGFVATFLALAFGTVIVMACGGLLETGVRNNAPPQRLAGADLVVTGDRDYQLPKKHPSDPEEDVESAVLSERVPVREGLQKAVRSVTGVRSALAERDFEAALLGGKGGGAQVAAHGWESAAVTPFRTSGGRAPTAADEMVLDAHTARAHGLSAGDRVRVAAHGGSRTYEVTGIAAPAKGRGVAQPTVFFSTERARELSGDRVADIAVTAAPGQDVAELKSRMGDALSKVPGGGSVKVVSGDDRGAVEYPDVLEGRETLIVLASVFGGLATLVAVFVVAGTVALSVKQRHREFALMRATGATPRQLRRMLLGETLMVAVFAAVAGWLAGPYAGSWLYDRLVAADLVEGIVVHSQGWVPSAAAAGALLLTALGGGWVGAHRAIRTRPGEALSDAALDERWVHPVRIILGVLCLAGAGTLALLTVLLFDGPIAASTAGPTVMCAVIGLALFGPGITKVVTVLVSPLVRVVTGPSGELAVLNSRARTVRMASVVVPVMLASGMALGNIYLQTTQEQVTKEAFRENLRADAVLTAPAGGVDPGLVDRVRSLDGVAAAGAYVSTTGFVERPRSAQSEDGLPLQGVTGRDASSTTAVTPVKGALKDLTGRTVALPEALAKKADRDVGDTIRMRLGDGAVVPLKVVALFEGRAGFETALAPSSVLAPHTTTGLPQQIVVRADSRTSQGELTAALREFAATQPGLGVADRDALLAANADDARMQAWVNYLMVGMIVAYTAIALVNSLVLSVSNRRREFGLQRLNGATGGQVLRMITVEALLVTGVGLLLGALAASTSLIPFSVAASDSWIPSGPLWIAGAVVGTACTLALGASLLSAWSVLRHRPVEAAVAAE